MGEVALANSRKNIRKLYHDGLIMKRQVQIHSRSRCKRMHEAKRKGRHNGFGKRKGTRNAREAKKISSGIYHHFYLAAKGNQFKNKTVLIESIHKAKQEKILEKKLDEQREARKIKAAEKKA